MKQSITHFETPLTRPGDDIRAHCG